MNLSLYTGGVKPYLEYGWVCAPNTAGQSIAANTITTLTIDTEIADTGNFGSIASNQITLAAGTYYFEANTFFNTINAGGIIIGLFNNSASSYISRTGNNSYRSSQTFLRGQFVIAASSILSLRFIATNGGVISNSGDGNAYTDATAGADQRTTLKLWKLA
jgi:hypothetical protein